MGNTEQLEVIQLDGFTPAVPAKPGHEQELSSRFGMLFLQPGSTLHGGFGAVARVVNLYEERFALKRLNTPDAGGACSAEELREMLFEEYKNQLAVSRLKGFPQVYGYGTWKGEPLILMEWIEGTTLARAMPDLPHEGDGVQGEVVAQVGISVLEILRGVERLDSRLVHRDISPNNIMFRTGAMSLSQQVAAGAFDTCLIDFGNSTTQSQGAGAAFTQRVGMLRGATREYAPPEMLTADVEGIEELRDNPAIDVYALCSVLYELYAGHTPFDLTHSLGGSDYRTKMSVEPKPLVARRGYEEPLLEAIMSGIRPAQDARPSVDGLLFELERWYEGRQRNGTLVVPRPVERPGAEDGAASERAGEHDETEPLRAAAAVPVPVPVPESVVSRTPEPATVPVSEPATAPVPRDAAAPATRRAPAPAPAARRAPAPRPRAAGGATIPVPTPVPAPGSAVAAAAAAGSTAAAAASAPVPRPTAPRPRAAAARSTGAAAPASRRAGAPRPAPVPRSRAATSTPATPGFSSPAPGAAAPRAKGAVSGGGAPIGFRDVRHSRPVRKLGWRLLLILAIAFALSVVSCTARMALGRELPAAPAAQERTEGAECTNDRGEVPIEEGAAWQG